MSGFSLVMSAAGDRGTFHLGVYSAFHDRHVEISEFIGASSGATSAIWVSSNLPSTKTVIRFVQSLGKINPREIDKYVSQFVDEEVCLPLRIPVRVVAVKLYPYPHRIVFDTLVTKRDIELALLSSCHIPALYKSPILDSGLIVLDGGVFGIPYDLAKTKERTVISSTTSYGAILAKLRGYNVISPIRPLPMSFIKFDVELMMEAFTIGRESALRWIDLHTDLIDNVASI